MFKAVWEFLATVPVRFSYHDILMNCLILMYGRFKYVDRFFYQYNNANWTTEDASTTSDASFLRAAGIDTSGVCLTWLIAMVEGVQIFTSKYQMVDVEPHVRLGLATHWVREWWPFFIKTTARRSPDGRFQSEAVDIATKWRTRKDIVIPEMLSDIVDFLALSSPKLAEHYYEFWK